MLSTVGTIPVAGTAPLFGVDRFTSAMRAITNIIGNGVATIVVSKWENEFDTERATKILNGAINIEERESLLSETEIYDVKSVGEKKLTRNFNEGKSNEHRCYHRRRRTDRAGFGSSIRQIGR